MKKHKLFAVISAMVMAFALVLADAETNPENYPAWNFCNTYATKYGSNKVLFEFVYSKEIE